jgi:hypothetical protein
VNFSLVSTALSCTIMKEQVWHDFNQDTTDRGVGCYQFFCQLCFLKKNEKNLSGFYFNQPFFLVQCKCKLEGVDLCKHAHLHIFEYELLLIITSPEPYFPSKDRMSNLPCG